MSTRRKIACNAAMILVCLAVIAASWAYGDVLVPVAATVTPQTMTVQVIDENGVETARLVIPATSRVITSMGGTPTPAPPFVDPVPPTPGKRVITILEQAEDRTPTQAAILTSQTLRAYLESKGHSLTIQDVDALTGTVPPNLPQLRIEDGDGNELFKGPLPDTVDATLETIKANGG